MQWLYFIPLIPLATYLLSFIRFHSLFKKPLKSPIQDIEVYRNLSLALVGIIFSISGILTVFNKSIPNNSALILYYIYCCLTFFS